MTQREEVHHVQTGAHQHLTLDPIRQGGVPVEGAAGVAGEDAKVQIPLVQGLFQPLVIPSLVVVILAVIPPTLQMNVPIEIHRLDASRIVSQVCQKVALSQ